METALRRLDGVDRISISTTEQKFHVTYKPGAVFKPAEIRAAVRKAGVEVVRFRISARGRVEDEGNHRLFSTGKQKFLLAGSSKIPSGSSVSIEGTVDDSTQPLQLKLLQFKSLK
jgi:cation transport ATPase